MSELIVAVAGFGLGLFAGLYATYIYVVKPIVRRLRGQTGNATE